MALVGSLLALSAIAADPKVADVRYELQLVAAEPDLVTPVGLAYDDRGRLLVIESHTHFRPEGYAGPPADRILLVEDADGDGKADALRTYYEGTKYTMGLRPGPDGWMYVATRMEVFRLKDADGDGVAETREEVVRLVTKGDYPHNGLSGLAFGPDRKLWFGMGENLGEPYELVSKLYIGMGQNRGEPYDLEADKGGRLTGGGEGGNVFRCDPDGSNLERVATGFWNPFGLCFDPHGRLFAVDNDPDASPPCRLLHVVPGGDYGFQFRYGRAGKHPLQAWDGELPGTLPMAAGTGEAPCAVVPHEGALWVTSWGHHRIERFTMRPKGATVVGTSEIVVQGDEDFRPVDLAVAPSGDVYFTDWVDKSYPLHGKGRLWRLRKKPDAAAVATEFPPLSDAERRAAEARTKVDLDALDSVDPFLHAGAVWGLVPVEKPSELWRGRDLTDRQRLGFFEASRWRDRPDGSLNLGLAFAVAAPDPDMRLYAVRWIADERITELAPEVEKMLERQDVTPRLFRAVIAALDILRRDEPLDKKDDPLAGFVAILDDENRPPALRATALRLLPAGHSALTLERLAGLSGSPNPALRREAIRTLAVSDIPGRFLALAEAADDDKAPEDLRADAVLGLAAFRQEAGDLLPELAESAPTAIAKEAKRILAPAAFHPQEARPPVEDLAAWRELVGEGGDPEGGWRVFFRTGGAACSRCHTLDGRGSAVGPDLTGIGRRMDRGRLLESMLRPSLEVAPQYVPWTLATTDGRVLVGLPVEVRDAPEGSEHFVGTDGQRFTLNSTEIESRRASETSLMPDGLEKLMTGEEIRDLLALLAAE